MGDVDGGPEGVEAGARLASSCLNWKVVLRRMAEAAAR